MKKELRFIPFLGQACVAMGNIFVDRKNTEFDLKALRDAKRNIARSDCIIFFPEGTRSRDVNLGPFKKGAFRMAKDLEFPIVPISLHGTHHVLATDSIDWKPGKVLMEIHRPIEIKSETDPNEMSFETREIIRKSLIKKIDGQGTLSRYLIEFGFIRDVFSPSKSEIAAKLYKSISLFSDLFIWSRRIFLIRSLLKGISK